MTERRTRDLPDRPEREVAATDFDHNLVVVAGAGTGKTSLLIERMLNALGSGRVEIDRLGAMTFTEKAAGEMRQRLASQLERLLDLAHGNGDPANGEAGRSWSYLKGVEGIDARAIADRASAALQGLDRATVTTIHGLCVDLLRNHAVAAGVDPDFKVDTGEKAELLRREVWDGFVARELGTRASRRALWRHTLRRLSLGEIERAAFALADFGLPPHVLEPPFVCPDPRTLFADEVTHLLKMLETLVCDQHGLSASAQSYFADALRHLTCFRDQGQVAFVSGIKDDAEFLDRIRERRIPNSFKRLTGFGEQDAKSLARETRSFLRHLLTIDDETIESLIELLGPFVIDFREAMLRQSLVSFDGLLVLARDLLRESIEIRRQLKRRFHMLLVDEFQDTDPVQYEIVLFLAETRDGRAVDAYHASLEPGKLFIVGDEKQSIYRFRGADFSAYRRAVEQVMSQGGRRLELIANFRSVGGVVEPVNRLFEDATNGPWAPSAYQPPYRGIRAVRTDDGGAATEVWTLELDRRTSAELRREAEGELIAERIDHLVRAGATRYGEITVLFRAFTSLAPYLRPLRHRRIPFVVDGGRDFLERPEVAETLAAIRALAQPADAAALMAFLRSPAGGVSDRELALYAGDGGRWSYRAEPSAERFPVIARRFRLLRELERETRTLPADAVVRHVIERTHLVPLNAAAFEGPQRVANLRKLANTAGAMARDGRLSLLDVAEALESSPLGELDSEAPLADDAIDAVRVSSIHRMKGLENRWIILPDLARGSQLGAREPVTAGLVHPTEGPTLALRVGDTANSAAVWRNREDRRHEEAEETRLLYVALTRARDRLIVIAGPSTRDAPWLAALRPWGFNADHPPPDGASMCDGRVLHRLMRPLTSRGTLEPYLHRSADRAVERYRVALGRMAEAAGPIAPSELGQASREGLEGASSRGDVGRVTGIVMHRLLERRRGESATETRSLARDLCRETATTEEIDLDDLEDAVRPLVDRFFESGLAEKLDGLDVIGREVPMLLRADGSRVVRGTIDLLYRDRDGRVVVADFKTDRDTDPARLAEQYGPQIGVYADAVRRAMSESATPARELWALGSGVVIRLAEGDSS